MNSDSVPQSDDGVTMHNADHAADEAATALQQAIRNRAVDTITASQARTVAPLSQRLLIIGMTLGATLVFVLMINFIVTGMRKIMDVWYPGSFSSTTRQPAAEPPPLRPDQPMYITVDPPAEAAAPGEQHSAHSSNADGVGK
jgi:hypothetical protein